MAEDCWKIFLEFSTEGKVPVEVDNQICSQSSDVTVKQMHTFQTNVTNLRMEKELPTNEVELSGGADELCSVEEVLAAFRETDPTSVDDLSHECRSEAPVVSGAVPQFQYYGGYSLPVIPKISLPPGSFACPPSNTAPNLTHLGYPNYEAEGLPERNKRKLAELESDLLPHSTMTKPCTKISNPKVNLIDSFEPFEVEILHICKTMMGTLPIEQVAGLKEKLTRIVDNHKRCRDTRTPIHVKGDCALKEDTTAFECCWSSKFGNVFPHNDRIMESFQQMCTGLVNQALISEKEVYEFPDFANKKLEEWFASHVQAGSSRLLRELRGQTRKAEMTTLAESIGLRLKQVERKWFNYQVKIRKDKQKGDNQTTSEAGGGSGTK